MEKKWWIVIGIVVFVILLIIVSYKTFIETASNSTEQEGLLDSCYTLVAASTNKSEVCERIQNISDKNYCYRVVAINKKDIKLCEKISLEDEYGKDEKDLCLSKVTGTYGELFACDSFEEKEECLLEVAKANRNVSICDLILNKISLIECKSEIFSYQKDYTFCDGLSFEKNHCKLLIAENSNDKEMCLGLSTNFPFEAGRCLAKLAFLENNPTLCNELTITTAKDFCFIHLVKNIPSLGICENIQSQVNKLGCYFNIAEFSGNEEACNKISDKETKKYCLFRIAAYRNDESLCEKFVK